MSIAEKLQTVAENELKVYEAGKAHGETVGRKAQYDEFWDNFQSYGERTYYLYGFTQWGDGAFYPKYDIKPSGSIGGLFSGSKIIDLKQRLIDCAVVLDTRQATNCYAMFSTCYSLTRVPTIDTTSATSLDEMFNNCGKLIEIEKIILKNDGTQSYSNTFRWCYELTDLTIEGVIGKSIGFQWCTKLSKASITSIMNALSTTTSGLTVTLSMEAVNKAFETSSGANDGASSTEFAEIALPKSNWNISLV